MREEFPEGYKKTEIGVIPEDWEVKLVRHFSNVITGGTPNTKILEFWDGDIRWMASGEVHKKFIKETEKKITKKGLIYSSAKVVPPKSVLVALAGQGRTRGLVAINLVELSINQSLAAILPSKNHIPEYLFYNLSYRYLELRKLSTGEGGRGGLNKTIIRNLLVPLPPVKEQRAIARILSDVDELIERLERLIEKKKDIKKGVMQELLTGKRRLPGFKGEWVKKRLGEIGNFKKGKNISKEDISKEGVKCILYGELYTTYHEIIRKVFTTIRSGVAKQSVRLSKGDILFTSSGETKEEIGKCATFYSNEETYAGGDLIILSPKDNDSIFLGYLFNSAPVQKQKSIQAQGDSVVHIYVTHLKQIELFLPPSVEEQRAIAQVLSDMDAEIEALQKKKEKYENIKKGMMELLLTGKVRVVDKMGKEENDDRDQ